MPSEQRLEDLNFPSLYLQIIRNFTASRAHLMERFDPLSKQQEIIAATFNGVQAKQMIQQAQRLSSCSQPVSVELLQQLDFPAIVQMTLSVVKPKTLRDVHGVLTHACHMLLPPGMLKIINGEHYITYEIDTLADFGKQSQTLIELIIGFFYFFQRSLKRHSVNKLQLHFTAAPQYAMKIYQNFFECELNFRAKSNRIVFPYSVIDLPAPYYEKERNDSFKKPSTGSLVLPLLEAKKAHTLVEKARIQLLMSLEQGHNLDREALALQLALSVRSLTRKLQEEGARFKALQNQVRIDFAKHLLLSTDKSIATIATHAGFQSTEGFIRAFRKLQDRSPGEFREHYLRT